MSRFAILVLATIAWSNLSHGLDEESAKEQKCFEIKKAVIFKPEWKGTSTMYYPLMSRLELYRTAASLTQRDFKDITDDEVYYDGCITFTSTDEGNCTTTGFNGLSMQLPIRAHSDSYEKIEFGDPKEGWAGTCYTTLTDNKTFVFAACCSNGNEMHWGVASTEKMPSKETVKLIHDHAESLGFKREYFTSLRYDSCEKSFKG